MALPEVSSRWFPFWTKQETGTAENSERLAAHLDSPHLLRRLSLALTAPIVMALIISAAGVFLIQQTLQNEMDEANQSSSLLVLVEKLRVESERVISALRGAYFTNDAVYLRDYTAARERIGKLSGELWSKLPSAGLAVVTAQSERVRAASTAFLKESEKALIIKKRKILSTLGFEEYLSENVRPLRQAEQSELDSLARMIDAAHLQAQREALQTTARTLAFIIGMVLVALFALAYAARRVSRYYVFLTKRAQIAIAQKNASVELLAHSNRELEHTALELRGREETLANTSRELERSNEALYQFNSIAARDLKEPL